MKNIWMKRLCRCVAFAVLFALLWSGAGTLLRGKWLGKDITGTLEEYKATPENTVDVLFVGSSNAFASISPLQLWQERGVTSFVLASAWQQVPASAYLLERALKTQTPKLVCFEVRSTAYDSHTDEDKIHQLTDDVPLSLGKWRSIETMRHDTDRMLYLMSPLLRFHTRWKSLTRQDYIYLAGDKTQGFNAKGYFATYNRMQSVTLADYDEPVPDAVIQEENLVAMDKMVTLCEEKGIPILFWKTPTEEWRKTYSDNVQAYADAHNIPFLDTNPLVEDIGISLTEDFNDYSHFNVWGARKFTAYMGEYLAQHYALPNHRGDAAYAAWQSDADTFDRLAIAQCDALKDYLARLQSSEMTAVLALTVPAGTQLSPRARSILTQYGLESLGAQEGTACAVLLRGGEVQQIMQQDSPVHLSEDAQGVRFTADVAVQKTDTVLRVDRATVLQTQSAGLSIAVYDHGAQTLADVVTFDVFSEACTAAHQR